MVKRLVGGLLLGLTMSLTAGPVRAGISFADPPGGWTYLYTGDKCATQFDACLDGKWHHYDAAAGGSDAWDGSAPGQMGQAGVKPAPGGAGIFQDGDVSFLRIQDPGDPTTSVGGSWADPSNRKITFLHNITSEVGKATTILDDGVTLTFRARIPTTPPLDPLCLGNSAPKPWVTAGYNIHDDGYGVFGLKQGTGGSGCISFSLCMSTDEGPLSGSGLTMNKKNGTSVTANVDSYDSGGTENTLTGFDPTQWHEFWIQIVKDTSGGGTHKVTLWRDGDTTTPRTFAVTAGSKNQAPATWNGYLLMSLGRSTIAGAQDIDFFGYKAGLYAPVALQAPVAARSPSPADQGTDVLATTVLSWTAGAYASTHDVYLGTDPNAVAQAGVANPLGVLVSRGQSGTTYTPAAHLAYGKTYYWRVDEVNAPPSATVYPGSVWSFTVEPFSLQIKNITATASSTAPGSAGPEKTTDGSGLNANGQHSNDAKDMWLSNGTLPNWIQYAFDQAYKLDKLLVWNSNQMVENIIGLGAKSVTIEYSTDGSTWTALAGVPEFARGSGLATYTANTTVNFGGVAAKYVKLTINSTWGGLPQCGLSEVQFFYVPVAATAPVPASGATGVDLNVTLSWRPGHEAASHQVFLGTDKDAVANGTAPAVTGAGPSYQPASLLLATTYYWKVSEVNAAATPRAWDSDVWSFTTQEYIVVEDFERYTDQAGGAIYETWVDGYDTPATNGATVGNTDPTKSIAETTIIHGGKQSLPLFYDNTKPPRSEATRTFDTPQNWTAHGIKSLALYFRGVAGNSGQLYLKINGTKVSYNGGAGDLAQTAWIPWNIDLSPVGGSLSKVTSLTLGVEGAGAKGTLYFDDIRLYPQTPEYITPADPGRTNLVALWALDGDAKDSSGHNLGGTVKQGTFVPSGRTGGGSALQVMKAGSVDLGNPPTLDFGAGDWAVTVWYKTAIKGTGDANKGTLYAKGGDNTGGKRYALIVSETKEGVLTLITDDDVTKYVTDSVSVTNDNQWHFAVGQRAGTVLQIYIDGQLEGRTTIPAAYDLAGTAQHNAYLGAVTNHADGSLYKLYDGLLDEVHVYNRALSAGEVLFLAGQTTPRAKPF